MEEDPIQAEARRLRHDMRNQLAIVQGNAELLLELCEDVGHLDHAAEVMYDPLEEILTACKLAQAQLDDSKRRSICDRTTAH